MRGRQMTLETALLNARQLHLMMRHCDKVEIATRSNMANSFCGATFETNPAGILKRPSHYVMELYTRHSRPIPLQVESPQGGPDVFACASDDKKFVTLFVVNTDAHPRSLILIGKGFDKPLHVSSVEAVVDTQNAHQIDVMNHWTAPDRVKTVKLESKATPGSPRPFRYGGGMQNRRIARRAQARMTLSSEEYSVARRATPP